MHMEIDQDLPDPEYTHLAYQEYLKRYLRCVKGVDDNFKRLMDYLEENGLDTGQYQYAFWGRFMTPFAALVMLFISVPFVFGSLRSVSAAQRVFIGMLVGFGFYLISQVATQVGQVFGFNPLLTVMLPGVVFLLFGIRAVRRL